MTKDVIDKKIFVIFVVLNIFFALIYLSLAFIDWTLILGHLTGFLVIVYFSMTNYFAFKKVMQRQKNSSDKKVEKKILIFIFTIISITTLLLVTLFFSANILYAKMKNIEISFFKPINFITFITPSIIFVISSLLAIVKKKKNINQIQN
ncbi:hypothetical protein PUW95_01800 [Metamycoplasma hyosynoviae]|uniref:hypothetical protein n=1 Tax=Metamycoplasma hyosynoviae TaxID=29559 RepID=UPI00046158E1|nr:hypothetical protein [Metamycoplasma hyosynoviae]KDE43403.1 hypothetical protein NPL1_01050 [Metamycoplasma hyosynoviae]KDE45275.1 hypothetical protein NPL2_01245 [Metamycoplasma hyosynoviae]MDC8916232.1 hypothetical protein [Metamycoplasma hyosynoviae]MDC8918987.1 hypothetical protein [Metamycoplasma hyosynoviae]MDC8937291.1 hypothetical protein [Metamycoplasma hyosynoviae]